MIEDQRRHGSGCRIRAPLFLRRQALSYQNRRIKQIRHTGKDIVAEEQGTTTVL